jgi:hypothetical protein
MNEENYDYEVDTNYGTKTYYSQVTKENKEWFKTLNVSVGLQKQVSSRFAIQVEPFVKVPLSGVGEGNISLASFGGFFSVRYNFLTLKKGNSHTSVPAAARFTMKYLCALVAIIQTIIFRCRLKNG